MLHIETKVENLGWGNFMHGLIWCFRLHSWFFIRTHTFMYFKAPVHGSSIPGYISREGYIARLTYPKRLCSLYGGLWASRVTLWSLLVCIPNEEGWFPLLSLFPMEEFMLWNSSKLVTTHRHMEALLLCLNKCCICQTDAYMQYIWFFEAMSPHGSFEINI